MRRECRLNPDQDLFILLHMSGSANPKTASTSGKATYRGITLPKLTTRSRFSKSQIKRAVEHAVAKHADSLARKT